MIIRVRTFAFSSVLLTVAAVGCNGTTPTGSVDAGKSAWGARTPVLCDSKKAGRSGGNKNDVEGIQPPCRTDLCGDPLPPHAIARFGTIRLRPAGLMYEECKSVLFSPDGSQLATPNGSSIRLWEARSGRETMSIKTGVSQMAFTSDGAKIFLTNGREATAWDIRSLSSDKLLDLPMSWDRFSLSRDGNLLAVACPGVCTF
jgi:WD40 repeat protein